MTPPAEASAMQLLLFSIIRGAVVFAYRPRRSLYHVSPDLFAVHTVCPRNQKQVELTVGLKWLWTNWLWNSGGRGRRGPNMTVDLIRLCTSSGCGRGAHVAVVLKWLWTSHVRDPTKPKQIV